MPKLHIGPGRLSFPKLFVPNSAEFGGKYGTTLLLPPTYDLAPLKAAIKEAAIEKFGPDMSKWPAGMRGPKDIIRKCEEKAHLAGYLPGWHFVSAASSERPGIVDGALADVTNEREAYAGRWAILSVNVYAYSNVKKGVALGLQNVQLRQNDDAFSSRVSARNEFEEFFDEMRDQHETGGDDFGGSTSGTSSGAGSDWDD